MVLINPTPSNASDGATGGEVMSLAKAMLTGVHERIGTRLEIEPAVV